MNTIIINKAIIEFRCKSFWLNEALKCEAILFYLKMTDGLWYKLSVSDGVSKISEEEVEPFIFEELDPADEFSYPISRFNPKSNYLNVPVKNVMEYLWSGKKDESCGILISLDSGEEFSIIDYDDCLKFIEGKDKNILGNCILENFY